MPCSSINVIYVGTLVYIFEKYFQCATIPSLTRWVYLHSFAVVAKQRKIPKNELIAVQGHPRSSTSVPIESA